MLDQVSAAGPCHVTYRWQTRCSHRHGHRPQLTAGLRAADTLRPERATSCCMMRRLPREDLGRRRLGLLTSAWQALVALQRQWRVRKVLNGGEGKASARGPGHLLATVRPPGHCLPSPARTAQRFLDIRRRDGGEWLRAGASAHAQQAGLHACQPSC